MLDKLNKKLSFLKPRVGVRAIITNTAWLVADRILRMGGNLIVGVWVARYLGVEQYGLFNYAYALVALFSPIATLGLDNVVIRYIIREPSAKEKILGTTFGLKFIGGVLALLLGTGTIFLLTEHQPLTVSLVAIFSATSIFQAFDTVDFWFQSQVQSKYTVVAKNTSFILTSLLKIYLITVKAPLLAFAYATLAEVGLSALGLVISYQCKNSSFLFWRWSFSLAKSLVQESLPLIFSAFAMFVNLKIDQVMLGQMVGKDAVGIYSAASRISELWYFIPAAIISSSAPAIHAAKKEGNENLYYGRLKKITHILMLVSVAIAVPMTFLSGIIITTLFGNAYAEAGTILSIHIWSSFFIFLGYSSGIWFVAEELTHLAFIRQMIGAIFNVLLNLLLIPAYSGLGAAIATVISYAFSSFLANAAHPQTKKLFMLQLKSILLFPNILTRMKQQK
ncbi:MAG: flippase [Gloeotrichia echinulata DEX184]|nr:flippase [Gloeotrichia echinulata DEX184]